MPRERLNIAAACRLFTLLLAIACTQPRPGAAATELPAAPPGPHNLQALPRPHLGAFHWGRETAPALRGADPRELAAIGLDETQRDKCLRQVALVFQYFEEWTVELLTYATAELRLHERWSHPAARQSLRA